MRIAGIVAEYNPFHNGHKYMIEQTRQQGATHIVAVMSGAVVQRGDVAVFDKHFRAETAVKNGVDLVVELPVPYSCSSGEIFGKSAVGILAGLGNNVVNSLAFGCESDDIELLKKAAKALSNLKDNPLVKQKLSEGLSYPSAVCETVKQIYGEAVGEILRSPNNTLAVEYIKSAGKFLPDADFIPVKRKSVAHDSNEISEGFASASAVRQLLDKEQSVSNLCPYSTKLVPVHSLKNMEREILFRLSCMDKEALAELPDCSEDIADRIMMAVSDCPKTVEQFLDKCKSKNITMARLRRIMMYAVLGVKKSDLVSPPFVRVLAFNNKGAEILAKCKASTIPVDTSLKALESTSEQAKRIIRLENRAVSFQQTCVTGSYQPVNEYRRKIEITK